MKKILIADDEESLRMLVRTTIEEPGYEILEAEDGAAALELARKELPDLIVLDWMMPGLSGIEVVSRLREDPRTTEIPVVMLTARGREADRATGRAHGVAAYLVKPFSPLQILETIDALLG